MVYREKTELIITISEGQDLDSVLPDIQAAGVEALEVNAALSMIIGHIAVLDYAERRTVFQRLKDIPSVVSVDSAIIRHALEPSSQSDTIK